MHDKTTVSWVAGPSQCHLDEPKLRGYEALHHQLPLQHKSEICSFYMFFECPTLASSLERQWVQTSITQYSTVKTADVASYPLDLTPNSWPVCGYREMTPGTKCSPQEMLVRLSVISSTQARLAVPALCQSSWLVCTCCRGWSDKDNGCFRLAYLIADPHCSLRRFLTGYRDALSRPKQAANYDYL